MKFLIKTSNTIIEALKALNENNTLQILFVIDEEDRLKGTLTDGDIRRFLMFGGQLYDAVEKAMCVNFIKIYADSEDIVSNIVKIRKGKIKAVPLIDDDGRIVEIYDLINYKSHLPVDAILMAGGKGERLRPLTEKTPKPLLKVGDKAIIDHNIDRLISYGIKNISVTVNYLKEQLEEHYQEPRNGVQVNCVREPRFLGTMGSIKFVETLHNDTILIMNSDVFTNIDYEDFYLHFKENDADMAVAAVSYDVSVPYGILDSEGMNIKGVLEKPTYNYFANAGIYLIKKEMLEMIPQDEVFDATDLIDVLVKNNKKVVRYPLNGTWIDIGNIQEYKRANELVQHTLN